jgi:hypothetical protein
MGKSDTSKLAAEQEKEPVLNKALKIAAIPIGALTGFWTASTTAHDNAYNTALRGGAFDDLIAKTKPKRQADVEALLNGSIGTEEYWQRALKNKADWHAVGFPRMKKLGLTNFWRKWRYMSLDGKPAVIQQGLTISGITIGALLSIANSKLLNDLFFGSKDSEKER